MREPAKRERKTDGGPEVHARPRFALAWLKNPVGLAAVWVRRGGVEPAIPPLVAGGYAERRQTRNLRTHACPERPPKRALRHREGESRQPLKRAGTGASVAERIRVRAEERIAPTQVL